MVLSNKKLKQKLRAALAGTLADSVAAGTGPSSNHPTNPDPNPQPQSLKELLDSAAPKPRLSKREKRRKNLPLLGSDNANTNVNGDNSEEKEGVGDLEDKEEEKEKKEKKRKRDESSLEVEDGVAKTAQKPKKKKNKKSKKNKKKAKIEEASKVVESENGGRAEQLETQTIDTSQSLPKGDVPTKVYVGGIPFYSTEDDIRSYFESCGTMTEVDCMRFPESGKFRGIAIISFKTEAAAKRALALDGADMGGLFLKIQPYKTVRATKTSNFAPEIVAGYNRIYVGNLSWDIGEDEIRKFFSDFKISSIRLGVNKETGEFKGYAHVDFSDSLSVTMALKLDQKILCGRPVKISCAVPRKEGTTPSKSTLPEKEAVKEADEETTKEADDESGMGLNPVSGKIRRRTCYECGEKGHLSSDCLATKKGGITPSMPVYKEAEMEAYEETPQEVDAGVNPVSGKIRRRTCYECGEKGHLSSDCLATKRGGITPSMPVYKEAEMEAYEETPQEVDAGVSSVSGKIRRRTCYVCGEKGHLSSACTAPKKEVITPSVHKDFNMGADEETPKVVDTGVSAVSGKMRRRTCYECGEKGHLSSDCTAPKKGEITQSVPTYIEADKGTVKEANTAEEANTAVGSLSGKIRRRTCYECGEKGHLSSACPKKLMSAPTNSIAN